MRETKTSDERRRELMDAAEKLFKKDGIVDTTVNSIVKEVDVAKGLFYYYFDSKEDVIDAISGKYNAIFADTMHRNMNGEEDWEKRLDRMTDNSVLSFVKLKEELKGDNEKADLSELYYKSMQEAIRECASDLAKLLNEGIQKKKIHISDPEYYADWIAGAIACLVENGKTDTEKIRKMTRDLLTGSGKEEK